MVVIFLKRQFLAGLAAGLAMMFLAGEFFFQPSAIQVLIVIRNFIKAFWARTPCTALLTTVELIVKWQTAIILKLIAK